MCYWQPKTAGDRLTGGFLSVPGREWMVVYMRVHTFIDSPTLPRAAFWKDKTDPGLGGW